MTKEAGIHYKLNQSQFHALSNSSAVKSNYEARASEFDSLCRD